MSPELLDEPPKKIPRIYLDQNALSMIMKGNLEGLKKGFMSGEYQLVYSDETMNEIFRCSEPDFHKKALDTLAEMKGLHLHVNDNESATGTNVSPHQLFEEVKNRDIAADQNINAMHQFIFKLHGGRQGESFADVLEGQKQAFEGLMENLNNQILDMQEEGDEDVAALAPLAELVSEMSTEALNSSIDGLSKQMNQVIPRPETFDGPNAWQSHFGVGAEQLNNIEPPKVIEQIWEQIFAKGNVPEQMRDLDSFLAPFYGMPQENSESAWASKIRGLYFFLNFAGYWPDHKRRKWGKFIGSQSDMNHAIYGAYSNIVISEDVRFVKKVTAIYEYLGLSTKVLQIVREKPEKKFRKHRQQSVDGVNL